MTDAYPISIEFLTDSACVLSQKETTKDGFVMSLTAWPGLAECDGGDEDVTYTPGHVASDCAVCDVDNAVWTIGRRMVRGCCGDGVRWSAVGGAPEDGTEGEKRVYWRPSSGVLWVHFLLLL